MQLKQRSAKDFFLNFGRICIFFENLISYGPYFVKMFKYNLRDFTDILKPNHV